MAVTQLPDGRWVCYRWQRLPDGARRLKKWYFGRGPDAEAAAYRKDGQLGLKKTRPRRVSYGPAVVELAEAYVKNKGFNENSRRHLKIRLKANILPFFAQRPAIRLSDADLDEYVKLRRAKKVKDATIARELTDLKAILNWSAKRTPPLIPFNPVRDYKRPREQNALIIPPSAEETVAILAAAGAHLKRAISLSYYMGLRPGAVELLKLTWDHVSWSARTILVVSADKGGPARRHVPVVSDRFYQLLLRWYKQDGEGSGPIVHYRKKPVKSIKKAWKLTLARAGIRRRIRPYDLRHGFVTTALEAGADIKALAEVVGSRPETLMKHYQHVTGELQRRAVASIPDLPEIEVLGIQDYTQDSKNGEDSENI